MRSGHHLGLGNTRHRYKELIPPKCERCDDDDDDLEHWMSCPGTTASRMKMFGYVDVPLSILTDRPTESVAMARSRRSEPRITTTRLRGQYKSLIL